MAAPRRAFAVGLRELRFLFCQTSEPSAHVRKFLANSYPVMKKHNPHTPILIREAAGIEPRMFARFEFGEETQISLSGLTETEIEERVASIAKQTPL